jgi:hypothetical protein
MDPSSRGGGVTFHGHRCPMTSEIEQMGFEAPGIPELDGLGGPAVKANALGGGQTCLDGVTDEGMGESVLGRCGTTLKQPSGDGLIQQVEALGHREIGHARDECEGDLAPDDRRGLKQPHAVR